MSVRPHVLMTTDALGGVWTYALDLGRGLARAGVRVTLAAPGPSLDAEQRGKAKAAGLAVVELGGALDWTAAEESEVVASAEALADLAARLRPDLIHLNSPALAASGPLGAPVLAACHSCVNTWWAAMKGGAPLPGDLAWRAALTARGYAAADALLAPSHAFARETQAAFGLAKLPHVVLNGRIPLRLQPPGGRASGDAEVFTAGRLWDQGKDVGALDRAAARKGFRVEAAGPLSGPDGASVCFNHLRSLGRLDASAVAARLARRPIFVSTSLYEPFGLAVLEAAQAGCPLVLSDIATFRELWDGAAVFFPPGDDFNLAERLAAILADGAQREALGAAARARAARYTAEAMTDATLELYATLSPAFAPVEAVA